MSDWFENRLSTMNKWEGYRYSVEGPKKKMKTLLDANENWHIPEQEVRRALGRAIEEADVRSYPNDAVERLRIGVSRSVGVTPDSVIPCAGADQAIDLLCRGFLNHGDTVTIVSPTFSMYRLRATIAGATCVELPMRGNFTLPLQELKRRAGEGGVLFICSPNNPTGTQFDKNEVLEAVATFNGLVVLDEAYVEFADYSLSRRVSEFRNLAVLRTFSKAYGIAGLRLGYILANDSWAPDFLGKVQYPYPVSNIAVATAISLMGRKSTVSKWVSTVKRERAWLTSALSRIEGTCVADSQANFLLVSLPIDSAKVHSKLAQRGVATRNVGDVLEMKNCLRVTVGTRRMNRLFLEALMKVFPSAA
jgi:histidinol-phosphate aminotransferase